MSTLAYRLECSILLQLVELETWGLTNLVRMYFNNLNPMLVAHRELGATQGDPIAPNPERFTSRGPAAGAGGGEDWALRERIEHPLIAGTVPKNIFEYLLTPALACCTLHMRGENPPRQNVTARKDGQKGKIYGISSEEGRGSC